MKAAESLGEIGDIRAIEPLKETLNDIDDYVRWEAARALRKVGVRVITERPVITQRPMQPSYTRSTGRD